MLPEQKIWLVIFVRVPCLYELIIAIKSDGTEELMRSCLLVQQKHREPRLRVHKLYHPLRPRGDSRDGAKISRAKVGTGWNFASLNFPPFPPPPPPLRMRMNFYRITLKAYRCYRGKHFAVCTPYTLAACSSPETIFTAREKTNFFAGIRTPRTENRKPKVHWSKGCLTATLRGLSFGSLRTSSLLDQPRKDFR